MGGIDILDLLSPHRPFSFAPPPGAASGPGLEHTLTDARLHYTLPVCRLEHALPADQLHHSLPREDARV